MTAANILYIARRELGTTEQPADSNKVKYNDAYGAGNVAWCCVFVWWVFKQAGASELFYGGKKTSYCPKLLSYHKGRGQSVEGNYQPGDIIFFNFSGGTGASHVGICESWDGVNITTIDGNTGTANEANGGAVMRRKRNKKYIIGAIRPFYKAVKKMYDIKVPLLQNGSTGDDVKTVQILLKANGHDPKGADGKWGANTTAAMKSWQKAEGLTADGICGPASWTRLLGV